MSEQFSVEQPRDETGLYAEPTELLARDLWTGTRLFTAAAAFFFLTFVFAFFYLRSLNVNGQWRPGIHPPTGYGAVILGCILASVVVYWLAVRTYVEPRWRLISLPALGLALAAVGIQCAQWVETSWGPTNGAYASVFIAWTGFYLLFLVGTAYWMETLVAESYRDRRGGAEAEARAVVRRANAEALSLWWVFLGLVEVAAFVILYIVA